MGKNGKLRRDLEAQVREVESQVTALREQLSHEIRTEHVVVQHDGVERVVLSAAPNWGSVMVRADSPKGETTSIELIAEDAVIADPAQAELVTFVRGNGGERWPIRE
jgi:hypothetical protein